MEHVNTPSNEIVVMYQSVEQIIRPPAPPDVSVCNVIMSCFSFLFLGVSRHYVKRPFSCWCQACSRVWGRGLGSQSSDPHLRGLVSGCTRTKQTAWIEDQFTVTSSTGILESREKGSRYCCEGAEKGQTWRVGVHTETREVWSTEEEANMWSGHFWICKLGTFPGSMTWVERKFELQDRKCKWEEYKGTRYSDGDKIKRNCAY
jgi:hypothetical protein